MSASPIARQACSHAQLIPAMRKVLISDPSQMPDVYSSTPNGTLYGTTPGGKKKNLERKNKENIFFVPRWNFVPLSKKKCVAEQLVIEKTRSCIKFDKIEKKLKIFHCKDSASKKIAKAF